MKKHAATLILAALVGLAIGTQGTVSFSTAQEKSDAAKPAERNQYRRVPPYYAQVGLSSDQKEEIYKLQEDAGTKIAALQEQIDTLVSKRDEDVRNVLTAEQQKKLDELIAAAKKKAEERRKKKSS